MSIRRSLTTFLDRPRAVLITTSLALLGAVALLAAERDRHSNGPSVSSQKGVMQQMQSRGGENPGDTGALAIATLAGGCFWCMEPPYDALDGVVSTISGYTGGHKKNPTYEEVSDGGTGHAEAVQITYDPARVTYRELLDVFWRNIDPTTPNRQFCDKGNQYRSAIFYHDEEQRRLAEESKRDIESSGRLQKPIVTEIVPAEEFYPAEEYHQDYYRKNPLRYKFYRYSCGRDNRLKEIWGKDAPHAQRPGESSESLAAAPSASAAS